MRLPGPLISSRDDPPLDAIVASCLRASRGRPGIDVLVELAGDQRCARIRRKEIAAIKGQHVQKPALLGDGSLRLVLMITGVLTGGASVVEAMNSRKEGRIVDHQRERLVQVIDYSPEDSCPTGVDTP